MCFQGAAVKRLGNRVTSAHTVANPIRDSLGLFKEAKKKLDTMQADF